MSYKVEATVDGIRFLYDGGEVEVDYNASDGDVVRLTIEPLEVKVTDGFRAAVKKACDCDSSSGGGSGGSGGGGVLVVHGTYTENADQSSDWTIDKTWQEIHDADMVVLKWETPEHGAGVLFLNNLNVVYTLNGVYGVAFSSPDAEAVFCGDPLTTDSANGYPSYHQEPQEESH